MLRIECLTLRNRVSCCSASLSQTSCLVSFWTRKASSSSCRLRVLHRAQGSVTHRLRPMNRVHSLSGRAARQICTGCKHYLQGTHQVSFFASGPSISGDILGVIDNGLSSSRLPKQDRQGVVNSVSCETQGRIPPGEIMCETGRNSGEIADLHHFCSK